MKWAEASLVVSLVVACAQPPAQEMELASQRLERAREEGASQYAEALYREAEDALTRANVVYEQGRPYREALGLLAQACLRAEEARREAAEQKRRLARLAHRCLRECAALMEEARARGRLDRSALSSFRERHAALESKLAGGEASEAYEEAQILKGELLLWLRSLEPSHPRALEK